ncbi:MAG TPA: RDD family protein [Steroidobacteraceae bacterium]
MNSETLIVTSPTGVDVELAIAGPGTRAYAFIIDWHIRLLIALSWAAGATLVLRKVVHLSPTSTIMAGVITGLPAALIYFLYHPVLEMTMRGRTPGKRTAGVRIVNREGGTPSLLAVLVRNAFRLIDSLPAFYMVGLFTTLFSAQHLRFGDIAAGTLLVRDGDAESKALAQLGSLALNPALDAGMAALGNDLVLRWKDLDPDSRRRLAGELLARIAPGGASAATPPGTLPPNDQLLLQQLRNALSGNS